MANFYNREKEKDELTKVMTSEPNFIYFVYGPINSGKTNLITEVIKELPKNFIVFYVNLRGRDISTSGDFLNVLFDVERTKKTEV